MTSHLVFNISGSVNVKVYTVISFCKNLYYADIQEEKKKISIQITGEAENVPSVISSLENVSDRYPQHGPSLQDPTYTHTPHYSDNWNTGQRLSNAEDTGAVLCSTITSCYSECNGKNGK